MPKNVLVTGASGNLGNYVASYLHDQGYNVTCTDIVPLPADGDNAKRGLPFVKADLLNIGDIMKAIAMAQADVIVHLGAIAFNTELQPPYEKRTDLGPAPVEGAHFNYSMPEDATMKINTMGMFYVLDAARRMGVKSVIAATSYFSYGMGFRLSGEPFVPEYLPIDEEHPCWPEDTYSLSKYLGEEIMKAFSRAYDMNTIAMRLMGVYYANGKGSARLHTFDRGRVYPEAGSKGDCLTGNVHQYVDGRDIAYFVGLALDKLGQLPNKYEAFNLVTDVEFNVEPKEFYSILFPGLKDKIANLRDGEGLFTTRKAEELLGYKTQYSWKLGK